MAIVLIDPKLTVSAVTVTVMAQIVNEPAVPLRYVTVGTQTHVGTNENEAAESLRPGLHGSSVCSRCRHATCFPSACLAFMWCALLQTLYLRASQGMGSSRSFSIPACLCASNVWKEVLSL